MGSNCYQLVALCYNVRLNIIMMDQMLHVELLLSCGANIITWKHILSYGTKCFHVGPIVIMLLLSGVIM
jgi:hypothetical protein